MNEETNIGVVGGIIIVAIVYIFIGFIIGMLATFEERVHADKDGCRYRSYAAYINPGYYATCELFRVRYEKPETDYYDNN